MKILVNFASIFPIGAKERLQLVKADLMEDGSFGDVIMGCTGVFHTASPVLGLKSDPKMWYALSKVLAEKATWEFAEDSNLNQAATVVSTATMAPLNVEASPNKLIELVAKGLAVERDEALRGVSPTSISDPGSAILSGYSSAPVPHVVAADFSVVQDTKGSSKSYPKHETRHISEHKTQNQCLRLTIS